MTGRPFTFAAGGRRFPLVLVRKSDGPNHLATPIRGGYRLACWHGYRTRPTLIVWASVEEIRRAWSNEVVCRDCADLYALGGETLVRVAGW